MKPCKYGHNEGRDTQNHCVVCKRARFHEWSKANTGHRRDYGRKYRAANVEKLREKERKRQLVNPGRRREQAGLPVETRPKPELCEMGCGRSVRDMDHCHRTGVFRGWLCGRCNRGLGLLGDTHEALERAAAYLVAAQSEMWLAVPGCGLPRNKSCR